MHRRFCGIVTAVRFDIGNGRVEAINNKVKVTVRMGYGFKNVDNLVALLMLRCGGCKPALPERPAKERKCSKRRGKRTMREGSGSFLG
ncbi:transposase [uncultured Ellagibacter sp.]|uniref:transposase n=1 Tax=uncultured Ellagibacter sp. TaxID=2137580 RepID=UPI0025F891CE|nr:transposase [uncultured Ellagibacter sp.]